jgi:hypothetical protein
MKPVRRPSGSSVRLSCASCRLRIAWRGARRHEEPDYATVLQLLWAASANVSDLIARDTDAARLRDVDRLVRIRKGLQLTIDLILEQLRRPGVA